MNNKKILVILTGGTICSSPDESLENKNQSNAAVAKRHIIADFERSASPYAHSVSFETRALVPDILSENMTVSAWNALLDIFREDAIWKEYVGVIVLHGTDTLAYTASLLSLALSGAPIPVLMVSAQLPLLTKDGERESRTNGYCNFRAAVELILNGIAPNVYAVYRNMPSEDSETGELLVHYGAHLLQCPNYSNDFHSIDEMKIDDTENARLDGKRFETDAFPIRKFSRLSPDVLFLTPYPCLDYSRIRLRGVRAVLHGTYHSETVCVGRKARDEKFDKFSILHLLRRCKRRSIPLFLSPCDSASFAYASTGDALKNGARYLPHTTAESAYAKLLIGTAMGARGCELENFLNTSLNFETVYR